MLSVRMIAGLLALIMMPSVGSVETLPNNVSADNTVVIRELTERLFVSHRLLVDFERELMLYQRDRQDCGDEKSWNGNKNRTGARPHNRVSPDGFLVIQLSDNAVDEIGLVLTALNEEEQSGEDIVNSKDPSVIGLARAVLAIESRVKALEQRVKKARAELQQQKMDAVFQQFLRLLTLQRGV